MIQCELFDMWADNSIITIDPMYSHDNLIRLPKEFARSQLNCYLEEIDILKMYTDTLKTPRNDFYKYMIYQSDSSIVMVTLAFEDKKFLLGIQQNHKKIEQFSHFIENEILANNPELLEYYNFYSIVTPTILKGINSEKIVPQYQLTKMENKCFLSIYNGYFTQEQLAKILHRSHRRIEDILSSLRYKLECSNKYELILKISTSHRHIQYLFQ